MPQGRRCQRRWRKRLVRGLGRDCGAWGGVPQTRGRGMQTWGGAGGLEAGSGRREEAPEEVGGGSKSQPATALLLTGVTTVEEQRQEWGHTLYTHVTRYVHTCTRECTHAHGTRSHAHMYTRTHTWHMGIRSHADTDTRTHVLKARRHTCTHRHTGRYIDACGNSTHEHTGAHP